MGKLNFQHLRLISFGHLHPSLSSHQQHLYTQTTMSETVAIHEVNGQSTEQIPVPPEIEATLSRLSAYRNVRGVMILSRSSSTGSSGGLLQSTGSVFEGEDGKRYATVVEKLVATVGSAVGEVDEGVSTGQSAITAQASISSHFHTSALAES